MDIAERTCPCDTYSMTSSPQLTLPRMRIFDRQGKTDHVHAVLSQLVRYLHCCVLWLIWLSKIWKTTIHGYVVQLVDMIF